MKTFPHPEITKAVMVADMIAHRQADELVAGIYGELKDGKFRGCAVGCSIHTINRLRGTTYSYGDHAAFAAEIGAPLALVQLQDSVFENLPAKDRTAWPERFYRAMPEGADVSSAVPRILIRLLREVALPSVTTDEWGVRDAVVEVCATLESGDKKRSRDAANAAAKAAGAAANAAHAAHAAHAATHAATHAAAYAAAYNASHAAHAATHAAAYAAAYNTSHAAHAATHAAAYAAVYAAYPATHPAIYATHAAIYAAAYNTSEDAWRQVADIICEEMERCGEGDV